MIRWTGGSAGPEVAPRDFWVDDRIQVVLRFLSSFGNVANLLEKVQLFQACVLDSPDLAVIEAMNSG
jgi:hypothetical protein